VEGKSLKKEIPYFETGDTVDVHCKIAEGEKVRVQIFTAIFSTFLTKLYD